MAGAGLGAYLVDGEGWISTPKEGPPTLAPQMAQTCCHIGHAGPRRPRSKRLQAAGTRGTAQPSCQHGEEQPVTRGRHCRQCAAAARPFLTRAALHGPTPRVASRQRALLGAGRGGASSSPANLGGAGRAGRRDNNLHNPRRAARHCAPQHWEAPPALPCRCRPWPSVVMKARLGSARRCPARLGSARICSAQLDSARGPARDNMSGIPSAGTAIWVRLTRSRYAR